MLAGLLLIIAVLYSAVGHAGASGYIAAMTLTGMPVQDIRPSALALNLVVGSIGLFRFARVGTALFGVPREHFRCTSDALTPVHPNFYRTKACALLRLP